MANDVSLSLRIPTGLLARLEQLRGHLEGDPDLAYLGDDLSRSMLLRLALQRGVEALEQSYGVTPPKGATRMLRPTGKLPAEAAATTPIGSGAPVAVPALAEAAQPVRAATEKIRRRHNAVTETIRPRSRPDDEVAEAEPVGASTSRTDPLFARRP